MTRDRIFSFNVFNTSPVVAFRIAVSSIYFENSSINISSILLPWLLLGSGSTKSTQMVSHGAFLLLVAVLPCVVGTPCSLR